MTTDPIANLLTSIRNAYLARRNTASVPYSRMKADICRILADCHYIKSAATSEASASKKTIEIELNYLPTGAPSLTNLKRLSTPSVRRYSRKNQYPRALSGAGIIIVSTSKGLMTDKQARAAGLGGEIICQVW